eukprot:2531211-Rhodomonas_salina.4
MLLPGGRRGGGGERGGGGGVSGTDVGYAATRSSLREAVRYRPPMLLRACYAVSGTELAYGYTGLLRGVRY